MSTLNDTFGIWRDYKIYKRENPKAIQGQSLNTVPVPVAGSTSNPTLTSNNSLLMIGAGVLGLGLLFKFVYKK